MAFSVSAFEIRILAVLKCSCDMLFPQKKRVTRVAWLLLLASPGSPGPPGNVQVEEITDTTAQVSWTEGTDNHSPITSYSVQARTPFSVGWQAARTGKGSGRCRGHLSVDCHSAPNHVDSDLSDLLFVAPEVIDGNTHTATVVELNPWVEYEFRVVASNRLGGGEPSLPSEKVRTEEAG